MKIVQINAIYGEKSTGSIVRELDQLIQQENMESWVVYRNSTVQIQNGIRVGNKLDWVCHAIRTRVDGKQGYGSWRATRRLLSELDRITPDVLHLHNVHSNFLNLRLVMQYAKRRSIAVILTLHDCWFFTGKCYHFADIDCEKWKSGCGHCPKRKVDIPSMMWDSSAKVFSERVRLFDYDKLYVVGCSKWVTSLAAQSPVFSTAKCQTIYNGVDTELFCPKNVCGNRATDTLTIVTMANKWFESGNKAVRESLLQNLLVSDRLMIIGCTEVQQQEYTKDDRVNTIGYVRNRKELAALYAQGDVFLNLTHIDTLPTVNMEALSCGTPVITYDAGGSGELVRQGETGYVVKPDDVEGVLDALEQIRNGAISREICRVYAESHFDEKQNFYEYLHLYQEIAGQSEEKTDEPII